jgi:hypothetical protein
MTWRAIEKLYRSNIYTVVKGYRVCMYTRSVIIWNELVKLRILNVAQVCKIVTFEMNIRP